MSEDASPGWVTSDANEITPSVLDAFGELFTMMTSSDKATRDECSVNISAVFQQAFAVLPAPYDAKFGTYLLGCAFHSPYEDQRKALLPIVNSLEAKLGPFKHLTGEGGADAQTPCDYLPEELFAPLSTPEKPLQTCFREVFTRYHCVPNFLRVIGVFPDVLVLHSEVTKAIFHAPGPLPETERYFLAIMASARNRCDYLLQHYASMLLTLDKCDTTWLTHGLSAVPPRLKAFQELNALLAHQPWMIKPEHIRSLLVDNGWRLPELLHAITVVTHVHALSGFVLGYGVNPDATFTHFEAMGGWRYTKQRVSTSVPIRPRVQPEVLDDTHTSSVAEMLQSQANAVNTSASSESESVTEHQLIYQGYLSDDGESPRSPVGARSDLEGFLLYCGTDDIVSQARIHGSNSHGVPSLNGFKFTYSDHCMSMLQTYYPGVAELIVKETSFVDQMTDQRFAGVGNIDTTMFRRFVSVYVHNLLGITYDDFDYCGINGIIRRDMALKTFVQRMTYYPNKLTVENLDWQLRLLDHEKVHIGLLAFGAKRDALSVLALNAVDVYLRE